MARRSREAQAPSVSRATRADARASGRRRAREQESEGDVVSYFEMVKRIFGSLP
jgi:hypothetical protein